MVTALHNYWRLKKGDSEIPAWSTFEFMDLYKIAPYMTVLDVHPSRDPGKLLYRFMGTEIVAFRRYRKIPDLTGHMFDEGERVYDPKSFRDALGAVSNDKVPVLMVGEYETEDSMGVHARLILPWTIDGDVQRLTTVLERRPRIQA